MKVAITGARSYSGKYITKLLLARGASVSTLTGHPDRPDPFEGLVRTFPLEFDDADSLQRSLAGCDVLVNTYWIRFDRGLNTQTRAVQNTRRLIDAAGRAGVRRVVHLSITQPSLQSDLPYFRGKAENEQTILTSGMSYAILRPTVIFGAEDILINNIAFLLRRFPFFLIPGDGGYMLQPIFVQDLAEIAAEAAFSTEDSIQDTVGPETFTFRSLVTEIGRTIGHLRPMVGVNPGLVLLIARILGLAFRDVVLTQHEIRGLMAGLLVSMDPPRGKTRLSAWLQENRETIGRKYASELSRHYM